MSKEEVPVELDPEFEAALEAALALEPTERITRFEQLAQQLQESLEQ
ncbi:MAG: GTPase [Rothia sp. (in: high G+C Gram-positive bacteria)]|nr:GTPase [Rothia sp. (in: high G+C Gram-positive bacteria)]